MNNGSESGIKKRVVGNAIKYKKLVQSWMRVPQVSAGSPREGIVIPGGSGNTDEKTVAERSVSSLKNQRVDGNSKKQFSKGISAPCHKISSDSHSKDARNFNVRKGLDWKGRPHNDLSSTSCQLDTELDKEHIACFICKLGGDLLHCDGKECNKRFHLRCVDPPFSFMPPGVWHCVWCVQKKIRFGIYSVSSGIESVLDAREVELDHEAEKQKEYLVKYRGLAHVHNCWITEKKLKGKAKSLLEQYKPQVEGSGWKIEWALPHRLLHKRRIHLPNKFDIVPHEDKTKDLDCQNEWLVKWSGLGYDHSTWELETETFLKSPAAAKLKRDFASRHKNARRFHCAFEEDEERNSPLSGIQESPYKCPSGVHRQHANHIDKLRKCWFEKRSSLVFDNEERFAKMVLFILSLEDNNLPFLIIAPSQSLSAWEAEFSRHGSSNIVVYKGNGDVRSSIRSLEFYNLHGCLMFHVLLSTPGVVIEDLEILVEIKWGGIIVDQFQRPVVIQHLEKIKALATEMHLLIANDYIKGSRRVYKKLISFISSETNGQKENDSDSDEVDPDENVSKLKEKLACFIAYECKHQRFSEYWVPVRLSNVQLELYCATLLSKATVLCSSRRNGSSNSLHELLVLERECCDHPYLVDSDNFLGRSLTKHLSKDECLKAEIEMSGKLQLLDKCLLHIKERGLRVLIIFQPCAGPGEVSTGDVLDDFVFQRFGNGSYVRIGDKNIDPSKKQAALKLFNNDESSSFVFLLEQRACHSSIKISSVDTVILFNSDWDPINDLSALRKISFQSHFQQLKVFRLYSPHTVEEKLLILAKQGLSPESLKSTTQNTCHTLLTWGALHLFDKLDQFHVSKDSNQSPSLANEYYFFDDVVSEFSALLPNNRENVNSNTKYILKVQQTKGSYMKSAPLHGEMEDELIADYSLIEKLMNKESSNVFWENLLEGRCPRWRFLPHMDDRKHPDKLPDETQCIEKAAGKIQMMLDSASTQLKPVLERKRKSCADQMGDSSAGRLACKKSKSYQLQHDKKSVNGKMGPSQGKSYQSSESYKPIIRELPVSELIATEPITNQTHVSVVQGTNGQEPQVLEHQSLEDLTIPASISQRSDVSISASTTEPFIGNKNTGHINPDLLEPQQGDLKITHQVLTCDSLDDTIVVDDFNNSSIFKPNVPAPLDQCIDLSTPVNETETFPRSQDTGTLLACNTQLPQVSHISLGGPHSPLLDPQQRDSENIQEIDEVNFKIKQDMKIRLRAEFEKEIDQVTQKYIKLIEDVETELTAEKLATYNKKVKESKSLVQDVMVKQKGIKRNDQRGKESFAISHCATTAKRARSPKSCPSPSLVLSSVVLNPAVPTNVGSPVTTRHSLTIPLSNPLRPIYQPQIPYTVRGIRAVAPQLRCARQRTQVSPISCPQTQKGMLSSSKSVGKTASGSTDSGDPQANNVSTSDLLAQLFYRS